MLCKTSGALDVAFTLGTSSVVLAASSDGETVHHRDWRTDERVGPTCCRPQADPPFRFTCRTDGGYRVGCDWQAPDVEPSSG